MMAMHPGRPAQPAEPAPASAPGSRAPEDDRAEALIQRHPWLGLVGNTPLARLDLGEATAGGGAVFAKVELANPGGSIKDRPVLRMLTRAVVTEKLTRERTILDSSSGNAGIAYAWIGATMGYRVELVVPANASEERKRRIRAHGAELVYTDALAGYDAALTEAHRRYEEAPERYFFCDQYANAENWRAHYVTTAAEILAQTSGRVTHFVAGVGTGGTITGVGRRLKEHDPRIEVVCILPDRFPGIEGLKPLGEPEDIVPAIFDRGVVDRELPVTSEDSLAMSHELARRGIFAGQSSGAYVHAAVRVAREAGKGAVVVTILNDLGERYFSARLWE
jgi:S-sulfo-L-cysteine synthase (O-acetyl-L-serine-dependent)